MVVWPTPCQSRSPPRYRALFVSKFLEENCSYVYREEKGIHRKEGKDDFLPAGRKRESTFHYEVEDRNCDDRDIPEFLESADRFVCNQTCDGQNHHHAGDEQGKMIPERMSERINQSGYAEEEEKEIERVNDAQEIVRGRSKIPFTGKSGFKEHFEEERTAIGIIPGGIEREFQNGERAEHQKIRPVPVLYKKLGIIHPDIPDNMFLPLQNSQEGVPSGEYHHDRYGERSMLKEPLSR